MRKLTTVIGLVLILALGLVATVGRPEPARALAMVHTAIYDAWAAYDPLAVGTQLGASRRPNGPRPTRTRQSATPPIPP
jgi:hypothetical protein